MPEFFYKGRSKGGELIEGRLAGASSEVVANRLVNIGVTPIEITAANRLNSIRTFFPACL